MSNPYIDNVIKALRDATEKASWQGITQARAALQAYDKWVAEAKDPGDGPDDAWYIERAREEYDGDVIDIDDDAIVSRGTDPGAYVAAWVWVYDEVTDDDERS